MNWQKQILFCLNRELTREQPLVVVTMLCPTLKMALSSKHVRQQCVLCSKYFSIRELLENCWRNLEPKIKPVMRLHACFNKVILYYDWPIQLEQRKCMYHATEHYNANIIVSDYNMWDDNRDNPLLKSYWRTKRTERSNAFRSLTKYLCTTVFIKTSLFPWKYNLTSFHSKNFHPGRIKHEVPIVHLKTYV